MKTNEFQPETLTAVPDPEQLSLLTVPTTRATTLAPSPVHARFRLSKTTRERGLEHVAEIRRQLAASHGDTGRNAARTPDRTEAA